MKLVSISTAVLLAGTAFSSNALAADLVAPDAAVEPTVIEAPVEKADDRFAYLALRGGAAWFDDTSFRVEDGTIDSVSNQYDDPAGFYSFAVGADFGAVRGELEFAFSNVDINTHTANLTGGGDAAFGSSDSFGDLGVRTAMVSAYYDFEFGSIKPFAGAGFGISVVEASGFGVTGLTDLLDDKDRGFAWQVTAGLAYEVMEGFDVELGYRYQDVLGIDLQAPTKTDFDLSTHTIFAGLRVAL